MNLRVLWIIDWHSKHLYAVIDSSDKVINFYFSYSDEGHGVMLEICGRKYGSHNSGSEIENRCKNDIVRIIRSNSRTDEEWIDTVRLNRRCTEK